MIPGIFITGTGTGVGKTVTTAGVLRWLRKRSINAIAMKPVQTGAVTASDGRMLAPDAEFALRAASLDVDAATWAHISPYLFPPACSPHLAARLTGRPITIANIMQSAHWLAARHDLLVVEGAGGLMAPLNEDQTMLDLAGALAMPVLLVGPSGLGVINHVLLSLEALRQRSREVMGVILNDAQPVPESERYICEDNVRTIEWFGHIRVLARVPYLGHHPDLSQLDASLAHCNFLPGYAPPAGAHRQSAGGRQ
jgi:dethiobiotin synthetase